MKYLILFFTLFGVNQLLSQHPKRPYEKLQLIGPQPIWYETSYDSSLVNDDCDGYNNFFDWTEIKPLVVGDDVYTILEVRTKVNETEGAIIEKRNLKDGKLLWKVLYDMRTLQYQEFPFKMYIGDDNFLYVHGFRSRADDTSFWRFLTAPRKNSHLTFRKINLLTGEIVEFYTPDDDDISDAAFVSASYERNLLFGDLFFTKNKDEFLYWERRIPSVTNPKQIIHFQKVNKFGQHLTEMDSVILGPINVVINMMQINEDTIAYLQANVVTQKLTLYYLDLDFKKIDSVLFASFPIDLQNNYMFAEYLPLDKILIRSYVFNGEAYTIQSALYNLKGELLDQVALKNSRTDYFECGVDLARSKIIGMKMRYYENPLIPQMELFESDQNGGIVYKTIWQSIDTMRMGNLFRIQRVGNDQFLIGFYESAIYKNSALYLTDNSARASSLMLFNAHDIDLGTVSTEEYTSVDNEVMVYPNPGYEQCTVHTAHPINGSLHVYNTFGNFIHSEKMEQNYETITLQTASWPSGLYIFVLYNNANGRISSIKWIKEK